MPKPQRQNRMATSLQTPRRPARNTAHSRTHLPFRPIRSHSPSSRRYIGSMTEGPDFSLIPSPPSSCSSSQCSSPPDPASSDRSPTPFSSPPELSDRLQTTTNYVPAPSAVKIPDASSVPTLQVMIPTPPSSPPKSNAQCSDDGRSLYIGAHFAEPCTVGCLEEILSCGHKVFTTTVEPCANNCHHPPHPSTHGSKSYKNAPNSRTEKEAFICPVCVDSFIKDGFRSFRISIKSTVTRIGKHSLGPLPFAWIQASIPLHLLIDEQQFRERIQELGRCCDAVLNEQSGLGSAGFEPSTATGSEPARNQKPEVAERKGRPPVLVRKTPALDQVIQQLRTVEVELVKP